MQSTRFVYTTNNFRLCSILSEPEKKNGKCVILCHGITDDKHEGGGFVQLANSLESYGYTVCRFDFRGHGESGGESIDVTVQSEIEDLTAIINRLQSKGHTDFALVGASFGAGAVVYVSQQYQDCIRAIVLWNGCVDYECIRSQTTQRTQKYFSEEKMKQLDSLGYIEIGSKKFRVSHALIDEMLTLEPRQCLSDIIPTLWIHGDKDSYIPYDDAVKYSNQFDNHSLVTIDGAEHGFRDDRWRGQAVDGVVKFFRDLYS